MPFEAPFHGISPFSHNFMKITNFGDFVKSGAVGPTLSLQKECTVCKEKAEHLKRSIEKIKGQRLKYSRDRRKRAAELEMKLQNEEHASEDKRQIQIQHFLDESHSLRNQRAAKQKVMAGTMKVSNNRQTNRNTNKHKGAIQQTTQKT